MDGRAITAEVFRQAIGDEKLFEIVNIALSSEIKQGIYQYIGNFVYARMRELKQDRTAINKIYKLPEETSVSEAKLMFRRLDRSIASLQRTRNIKAAIFPHIAVLIEQENVITLRTLRVIDGGKRA